jgi:hypothetical protein
VIIPHSTTPVHAGLLIRQQFEEAKALLREACGMKLESGTGPSFDHWKRRAHALLEATSLCQACNLRQAVTLRSNGHLLCQPCWDEELLEEEDEEDQVECGTTCFCGSCGVMQ